MYILQNYRIKAVFDITEPLKDPEKWVEKMKGILREDCEGMNKSAIKALTKAHRDELLAKYSEGNDCQISIDGTKLCVTLNDKCITYCYSDKSVGIDFEYSDGWVEESDIQEWFLHFFEREFEADADSRDYIGGSRGHYACDDFNNEKEKLKISTLSVDYENDDIMYDKWGEAMDAEGNHEKKPYFYYKVRTQSLEVDTPPSLSELYFDDEQKAVDYLNTCDNGEIEKVIIESPRDLNYSDGCTLDDLIATEGSCDIYRRLYIPYQPPHENELSDEEVEH